MKKYNDDSKKLTDWTTGKLKEEAKGYHETINKIGCYGTKDLINYDRVLAELEKRGIEPSTELTF